MIRIYTEEDSTKYLDTTDARALVEGFNKRDFTPQIRKLYIRNDEPTKWMSNIEINATSNTLDLSSDLHGFGFKFYQGDLEPSDKIWDKIDINHPIRINNIGTSLTPDNSYYPIWLRIEASPYLQVSITEFNLIANYIEHPV